jgi:biopolymer transport protein TolR
MGMQAPKTSSKAARRPRYQPTAEINVTPMVDVMLVLLIVFMVAAPLLSVGVPVNLPKAGAQSLQGDDEPLAITIDAAGKIFIEEKPIALKDLVPRLQAILGAGYDQRIYGQVAQVVARINAAGFSRVALVTDHKTTPRGGK